MRGHGRRIACACACADRAPACPVHLPSLRVARFCYLQHSIGVNLTVSCPKSMVGRVIGKGGDTIKGLQRKYHTSIQVGSQVRMTNWALGTGRAGRAAVVWAGRR